MVDRVRLAAGNRIDQRQGFLRVISITAGQVDCEWDALCITDQMPFAPALWAIGGIRTRLRAATDQADIVRRSTLRPVTELHIDNWASSDTKPI